MINFTEELLLEKLITNDDYFTNVFPYLNGDLFENKASKIIFGYITDYNNTYNRKPTLDVIRYNLENTTGLSSNEYKDLGDSIIQISTKHDAEYQWLLDESIAWVRKRTYYNALLEGIKQFDGGKYDEQLPDNLNNALSITFDSDVGMKFSNPEERWKIYTDAEEKLKFGLPVLNSITRGGINAKTGSLNLLISTNTGGFKSGTMVHFACDYMKMGKNVLYISMEMSPEKILERIDANLLDVEIDNLTKLGKEKFMTKIEEIKRKTIGDIIVKQYPTCGANTNNFRHLLKDLRIMDRFIPDVIFVDYLNICSSSRFKSGTENSYGYIKSISEELRGLGVEYNVPIWTASQSNRGGEGNEYLSLTDISDSYGIAFTADFVLGIITTEEFDKQNKILYRQLKNRYDDPAKNRCFFLGVNKAKMKLYDTTFDDVDIVSENKAIKSTGAKEVEIRDVDIFDEDNINSITINKKKKTVFGW